jgi:hypothetical protein
VFHHRDKTECKHGHPFNAQNTRVDRKTRRRSCIECGRIRSREYQRRKRGPKGDATALGPSIGPQEVQP